MKSNKPTISFIVAVAKGNAIGLGNDLLVHIPGDLKRFKEITTGHSVIMGKKTFDSLPRGPLPNRRNIVMSRNKSLKIDGCEVVHSIDEAIELVKNETEVFIIGGGNIYNQMLTVADKLYLTMVDKKFEADVFFPEIDWNEWCEESRLEYAPGEVADFGFSYVNLIRKKV